MFFLGNTMSANQDAQTQPGNQGQGQDTDQGRRMCPHQDPDSFGAEAYVVLPKEEDHE
ncbi:MAG: hypothetical protein RI935_664 [Candidatus Parcubacteria bacterium]|jgi:hypothetical protein